MQKSAVGSFGRRPLFGVWRMVEKQSSTLSDLPGFTGTAGHVSLLRPQAGRLSRKTPPVAPSDLSVRAEDPRSPDAQSLLNDSQAALLKHLPEDQIFSINYEDLAAPNVVFFVARANRLPVGCVALVDNTTYGEVKRLYLRETVRGLGLARALMGELEQFCRDVGLLRVKLETSPLLEGAEKLYTALGYRRCAPFGDYPVLDSSLFMEKELGRLF